MWIILKSRLIECRDQTLSYPVSIPRFGIKNQNYNHRSQIFLKKIQLKKKAQKVNCNGHYYDHWQTPLLFLFFHFIYINLFIIFFLHFQIINLNSLAQIIIFSILNSFNFLSSSSLLSPNTNK